MIKAVFIDFDHTVYSHKQKAIPESTKKGLKKLQEKGIKCVLTTGRAKPEIDLLQPDFQFDNYILLNGQIGYDKDFNCIFKLPFEKEQQELVTNIFKSKEFAMSLIEENRMYANFVDHNVLEAQKSVGFPRLYEGEYNGEPIYQSVLFVDAEAEKEFRKKYPEITIHRYCPFGLDLLASDSGKHVGIKKYIEIMGIKQEETMGFGDGLNDVDLLNCVSLAVAMGNACDEAKAAADYITDDIEEEGLYNALVHFGLIEE